MMMMMMTMTSMHVLGEEEQLFVTSVGASSSALSGAPADRGWWKRCRAEDSE